MKWNAEVAGQWKRCFAIIPVRIGAYWVWLEYFYYREDDMKRGEWITEERFLLLSSQLST